jgi:hypothetical protein
LERSVTLSATEYSGKKRQKINKSSQLHYPVDKKKSEKETMKTGRTKPAAYSHTHKPFAPLAF